MPLKGRGFTLIEVAITVTIMAILAVVAAASWSAKKIQMTFRTRFRA